MSPKPFWNRNVSIWLLGAAQDEFGSALAIVALSMLVLHQTNSAGMTAITFALGLLPALLGPLMGVWVERMNLKLPLIASDVVRGMLQLGLGLIGLKLGHVPLILINSVSFLLGLATVFNQPAWGRIMPLLVPFEMLTRANGLMRGISRAASLLGLLVGGWLVATFSPALAIALDGLSFLLMALTVALLRLPSEVKPSFAVKPSFWAEFRSGFRLLGRTPSLWLIPVSFFGMYFGVAPVLAVTPKLLTELGEGPRGYGLFLALQTAGASLAGILIAWLAHRLSPRWTLAFSALTQAIAFLIMWLWPLKVPLLVGSFLFGLGMSAWFVCASTLTQQLVPASHRARIFGITDMAWRVAFPLAYLLTAALLDRWPLSSWYGIAALFCLLGALAWFWVNFNERTLPNLQAWLNHQNSSRYTFPKLVAKHAALPLAKECRQQAQALAMLDALLAPSPQERCYTFKQHWSRTESMAAMNSPAGDSFFMVFTERGCIYKLSEQYQAGSEHSEALLSEAASELAEEYLSFFTAPGFLLDDTTQIGWYDPQQNEWVQLSVNAAEPDRDLLHLLRHGTAQEYQRYATEHLSRSVSLSAIERVLSHQPLSPALIKEIGSPRSLVQLRRDAQEIGYALAPEIWTEPGPDKPSGSGQALPVGQTAF